MTFMNGPQNTTWRLFIDSLDCVLLAVTEILMAKSTLTLIVFVLFVLPALSDGPKPSDPQPEFFFTRLAYPDIRGRGPVGNESSNRLFRDFADGPNGIIGFFG